MTIHDPLAPAGLLSQGQFRLVDHLLEGEAGLNIDIATYASAATMTEVGFHHFFRKRSDDYGGDLVLYQPHASPGVYARAFVEGRLSEAQVDNFRRELQPEGGLSSYPHPRLMPDFWEMPTASMGLSTPAAIYQARFARYLENRGLKADNGHSHVLASTYPNLKSYDPAFAFELAVIVRDGIRRMYQEQENILYYITLYNETYPMPEIPADESIPDGVLRGAYCFQRSQPEGERIHLLSSGAIMQQALTAAQTLEAMGYAVDIWSVTSFNELHREAEACERWSRLHPLDAPRKPYVEKLFEGEQGIAVAATDYMKALPNSIAKWMPGAYTALGTDGFGLSESRESMRDFFEISGDFIAQAALATLYRENRIDRATLVSQTATLDVDPEKIDPAGR